ncbi:hypothetical protein OKJ48_41300 [Streptomyces kunmingensis]|uniref:Integral membrane protein n=1 Tax=Streptomyces kunmingensis TaxID=68225 RepID=A0ABU6CPL2_9ACTN|nr:hypothetical protein [Streptomyces kunmingensis]MEB3966622.1 hypothetical protein [Streptomyces kunmingensis]
MRSRRRDTPYGERFTLFAEVLWIGLLVAAGSLLVVTWPAAMAAGCAEVRRCVPDGPSAGTGRRFWVAWRAALRGGSRVGVVGLLVLGFLGADLRLAAVAGDVPLFGGLVVVVAGVAGVVVVVQIRVAARWSLTGGWHRAGRDPVGTVMLAGAVLVSAVCVWQLVLLAPLVAGVLALAAVAVDRRSPNPPGLRPGPRSSIAGGAENTHPGDAGSSRGAGNCATSHDGAAPVDRTKARNGAEASR